MHYWLSSASIKDSVYIPKYYNPEFAKKQAQLSRTHVCRSIGELVQAGLLCAETGHEIGKAAYGTGDIPFVRNETGLQIAPDYRIRGGLVWRF